MVDGRGNYRYYDFDELDKGQLFEILADKKENESANLWLYDFDEELGEYHNGRVIGTIGSTT